MSSKCISNANQRQCTLKLAAMASHRLEKKLGSFGKLGMSAMSIHQSTVITSMGVCILVLGWGITGALILLSFCTCIFRSLISRDAFACKRYGPGLKDALGGTTTTASTLAQPVVSEPPPWATPLHSPWSPYRPPSELAEVQPLMLSPETKWGQARQSNHLC